jgi:hypothetical protein
LLFSYDIIQNKKVIFSYNKGFILLTLFFTVGALYGVCGFCSLGLAFIPNNFQLAHYLAGLIEADGSIHVPKAPRSNTGKLCYVTIKIPFAAKVRPLAEHLKPI